MEFMHCTGFTYNHEFPRKGKAFIIRKITSNVAQMALGLNDCFELGNIKALRDWGYAPEYVIAMHKMLIENEKPKDYVISTGILHTVEELLKIAFEVVNLDYRNHIKIKDEFVRPSEITPLVGDSNAIYKELGWKANKKFEDIIREMVIYDIEILKNNVAQY